MSRKICKQVITRLIYAFLQNSTVKKKFTENAKYPRWYLKNKTNLYLNFTNFILNY